MAYADYEFYTTKYYGSAIPDSQSFDKEAERASDFLDIITFERLVNGLPDNERAQTKIKKAVCALADKLYGLELAEKQALSAAAGSITSGTQPPALSRQSHPVPNPSAMHPRLK